MTLQIGPTLRAHTINGSVNLLGKTTVVQYFTKKLGNYNHYLVLEPANEFILNGNKEVMNYLRKYGDVYSYSYGTGSGLVMKDESTDTYSTIIVGLVDREYETYIKTGKKEKRLSSKITTLANYSHKMSQYKYYERNASRNYDENGNNRY